MINALEAVIAYLKRDTDLDELVAGRIADKHRFGQNPGDWPVPSKALQVRHDGGAPELYLEVQHLRLEARCYGESRYEASRVYQRLVGICRGALKEAVGTAEGKALIYWLNLSSSPSAMYDPDVRVDGLLVFLDASVAENDVL